MLVVGLGNPYFSDDGLGYRAVRELGRELPAIHLLSPGTDFLRVILGKRRVAVIDAVKTGEKPGTFLTFNLKEIKSYPKSSTHTLSISDSISLGYILYPEEMPEELLLFGVEAKDLTTFKRELSPEVEKALPKLLREVKDFIKGGEDESFSSGR